eukprot:PhM_4_TR17520/c4_g1_i1/m.3787
MSNTRTEHFRKLFRFGYNPTATCAVLLLRTSTHQEEPAAANGYHLCDFTTKDVLAFCIDTTCVLVVDIADGDCDDVFNTVAPTCLVVDGHRERSPTAKTGWSQSSSPRHFIFASMPYSRALDWIQQSDYIGDSVSIDMANTYSHESAISFSAFSQRMLSNLHFRPR